MIRADVVRQLVEWKQQGGGPDPERKMYALINNATPEELFLALRQYLAGTRHASIEEV